MFLTQKGDTLNMVDEALVARFRKGDFTGVTPVIINIAPMPSVAQLLGMN
jgi:hypothetical protein